MMIRMFDVMGMKLWVLDDLGMRIYGYLMFRHENIWVFDV